MPKTIIYHVPVCPFAQRLEILLALKGAADAVDFHVLDITRPRPDWFLKKTRGTTASPVLETGDGRILKESLVLQQYLDEVLPEPLVAQRDPYRRGVEGMLVGLASDFGNTGYGYVLNQELERRDSWREAMLRQYARLDAFLVEHAPGGPFLFEDFGWAETVFTPLFMRFWFLDYYEDFELPADGAYDRVLQWSSACLSHPAVQQVTREEIVKLYYDYAKGAGNGSLLPGRRKSSFVFLPDWRERPWPPSDKYGYSATDEELGL